MRAGRDEVLDIFRKWLSEKTSIRVEATFRLFAFCLWGRILSITPDELRIFTKETEAELVLKLAPELDFGYGASDHIKGMDKDFSECIVIFFGPIPDVGEADHIALATFKPSS
jgi:hypothetical protein